MIHLSSTFFLFLTLYYLLPKQGTKISTVPKFIWYLIFLKLLVIDPDFYDCEMKWKLHIWLHFLQTLNNIYLLCCFFDEFQHFCLLFPVCYLSAFLSWWVEKRFISSKDNDGIKSENEKDPNILLLERELTTLLGLKTEINHKANNSGNLTIFYKSIDQIQPVLDKLKWKPKWIED